jgi:hypothetical protein
MHFASDWLWRAGFSISVPISKLHVSPQTKHDTLADLSNVLVLGPCGGRELLDSGERGWWAGVVSEVWGGERWGASRATVVSVVDGRR